MMELKIPKGFPSAREKGTAKDFVYRWSKKASGDETGQASRDWNEKDHECNVKIFGWYLEK